MKFGVSTTADELLNLIKTHLEADPPALFNPGMALICGPDEEEFKDRGISDHYVEIRAPDMEYLQEPWAGGGENTQLVRMPIIFSLTTRYDVDLWKTMWKALADPSYGALVAANAFMRYMLTFDASTGGKSKLFEPIRPGNIKQMRRDKNMFFRLRIVVECRFCEDMGV